MSLAPVEAAAYDTKQEVDFTHGVIPDLHRLGVTVEGLRHTPGTGELHVTLYLPTHTRTLREQVISRLQRFEEAWAYTVIVAPGILYTEDLAE